MKVSVEVYKIVCAIYSTIFFFTSGGSVDGVLMRLSLVAQIIKDANLALFDMHFIQRQTFTDILGIVNGFVQFVYIPI